MRPAILIALLVSPAFAQEIRLPASLQQLASKAEESVDVTLEGPMLKLTSRFLSDTDKDEAKVKKALAGLENITVRSYKFADDAQYNPADLNAIRDQLKMPVWSRLVGVRSKDGDNTDVYLKVGNDGIIGGVVIMATRPREFTFVSIVGKLDVAQLADIGGRYHIPELDMDSVMHGAKGDK